jgi:ribosome-binding factor A
MANERRINRVSKQIEREISIMLQGDQVLQSAICPERREGYDSSLSALASITEVRLSSDLQVAKIYLSIYSDEEGRETALRGLSKLQGYVRTKLAAQMQLRMVPEVRFIYDEAAERGEEVLALLDRIKRQDAGEIEPPPLAVRGVDEASGKPRAGTKKDENTEDGFLDLEGGDDDKEGFLTGDYDADDYDYDEDEDRTSAVISAYLSGREESAFDKMEEPSAPPPNMGPKRGRKVRRRKYRPKF